MNLSSFSLALLSGFLICVNSVENCEDLSPPNCDLIADCLPNANGEGCYLDETADRDTTSMSTTSAPSCDDDDDAHNWSVDYIGQSTQFRLYRPCDGKFIKFKMEDLTEYDGTSGRKTNNKETAFASSDWKWGAEGVYQSYQGANAIINVFNATQLTRMDASFVLTTIFFREDAVIGSQTVSRDTVKFNVAINDWQYQQAGNYLELCIGIMTNSPGTFAEDDDATDLLFNNFQLLSDEYATCGGQSVNVTVTPSGNSNNHLKLCYAFGSCSSGNLFYDPIVEYVGDEDGYDDVDVETDDEDVSEEEEEEEEEDDNESGDVESLEVGDGKGGNGKGNKGTSDQKVVDDDVISNGASKSGLVLMVCCLALLSVFAY